MTIMTIWLRWYAGKVILLNRDRGDKRGRSGAGELTPAAPSRLLSIDCKPDGRWFHVALGLSLDRAGS